MNLTDAFGEAIAAKAEPEMQSPEESKAFSHCNDLSNCEAG